MATATPTAPTFSIETVTDKLPTKYLEKRIPATLTMNTALQYYTVWNWVALAAALVFRAKLPNLVLYSQASSLLIACIIALTWLVLGWPFFNQFYGTLLGIKHPALVVVTDLIVHFSPLLIIGLPSVIASRMPSVIASRLPSRTALPVFMPLLTFWVWYISMRPHMKSLYGVPAPTVGAPTARLSFTYDRIALGGTAVYLATLGALAVIV
jgi:hypothetical protein